MYVYAPFVSPGKIAWDLASTFFRWYDLAIIAPLDIKEQPV
jgi:hypothetical protein